MKVFGKTFEQKQKEDEFDVSGYSESDENAKTLEGKVESMWSNGDYLYSQYICSAIRRLRRKKHY